MKLVYIASVSLLSAALTASAQTTVSSNSVFGPLPVATFGGTGQPNSAVQVTTLTTSTGDTITLGLAAQQRYNNPAVGNNGAGTFYATPGENYGNPSGPGPSTTIGATWNFDYYVNIAGGGNFSDYTFNLYYNLAPSVGGSTPGQGTLFLNSPFIGGSAGSTTANVQDSENLDFSYLNSAFLFTTVPPADGPFNPNATGQYDFTLVASDGASSDLGSASIVVDVGSVPDHASTALLLGFGTVALLAYRRSRVAA